MSYIALIEKEPETDFWVRIPDIPGCVACGETVDDAVERFASALEAHIAAGGVVRPARPYRAIEAGAADSKAYVFEIEDGRVSYRAVPTVVQTAQQA